VVWVGTRTERFDETVRFFTDVLGVELERIRGDFAWSRMPNSSQLEVFGTTDPDHDHFTTGPVPEFLVDDLPSALDELRAAGVELLGEPVLDDGDGNGWLHVRGPDGDVYGLTTGRAYRR
jgi:catechol 2,3-dioxygenase-like lactoylglutathione lyase family enzyme